MTTYFQLRKRYLQIYAIFALVAIGVFAFWAVELRQALSAYAEREEAALRSHQELLLERKGRQVEALFHELYQSTRTIALLPMIRGVRGENRRDAREDVVAQGRLSLDAHRTLQQIYASLQDSVSVSEIYLVLDGFDPVRQVPFFMYDALIAQDRGASRQRSPVDGDIPPAVETEEYRHFPVQLDWFRAHAPEFRWARHLDRIPVRLSPVLRTCDNTQYLSLRQGNVADTHGFIYAMPVYARDSGRFTGMVTAILRNNVLEALLLDVPFVPVTPRDEALRQEAGWSMPPPSSFRLRQADYGIVVRDRRHPQPEDAAEGGVAGRWARRQLDLKTGAPWQLEHFLGTAEMQALTAPIDAERQRMIAGRMLLLLLLAAGGLWNFVVLNRTRRELMHMTHFDALTALPNRRLFLDQLQQGLARARRHHNKLALLLLDVANFNAINDAHGAEIGDYLLAALAGRLQQTLRGEDFVGLFGNLRRENGFAVARLGGDQFTVICEDVSGSPDVVAVLDRLLPTLRAPFQFAAGSVELGVNIGVAVFPDDAPDADKLLVCAEGAMTESRREALPYFLFNEKLRQRSEREFRLSRELKRALEQGEFELFYQPKADLASGRIISLEALLRWRHPQLGLVSPAEFVALLERSGGIIEVGRWVLEQACRDLARLGEAGCADLLVSVNVSVRQLRRGDFHQTVAQVLAETGTAPRRLILEVTESMMMESLDEGRQLLRQIDHLGVKLAIDDFGTGFSSMTYLQHLPLSYLKLDKAFIDDIETPRARHIAGAVIHLAKGLALRTIAEGVEREAQRAILVEIGCDIMQGYLLSKPLPLAEIVAWLHAYRPSGALA